MKKKILIVIADYYKDISIGLLKSAQNHLPKNFSVQIIKDLKIKNMTLITKSPKKVIGLDGFGIKITKQEII